MRMVRSAGPQCRSKSLSQPRKVGRTAAFVLGQWLPLLLILLAWAIRLYRLDFQDIWWDEARNIDVASLPLPEIATSGRLDIHPPLYFYLLHGWMALAGRSAFATRLLSTFFGILGIALVYPLARGLASGERGRLAGLLALALAAFSPFGQAEAQETRMYTVSWVLLLAAVLVLPATASSLTGNDRYRVPRWALFATLVASALLVHYGTALVLAAWACWLLIWAWRGQPRQPRLLTLLAVGLATGLLLLPAMPIAWRQIPRYDNPNLVLPALRDYLSQLWQSFTLGEALPPAAWRVGRWLWLFLMAGGIIAALLANRQRRPQPWSRLALVTLWLFGGLAIYYLILIRRPAFNPRYISFVLPALWALSGWALAGWHAWKSWLPWLALLALLALSTVAIHADLTDPRFFREDMRGVVAWLQERTSPNSIILVDQAYPFGFYWERWNNDPEGFPPPEPATQAPAQYLFVDINHVDERLTALAGNASEVFWVTWFESDTDPRGAVATLLDGYGQRVEQQAFRGYTVTHWHLRPPTRFRLPREFRPLNLHFEPGLTLIEGDWWGRQTPVAGDATVLITLRWQTTQPTAQPLKASLRLKDPTGHTVAQNDRLLLNDRHLRTTAWPPATTTLNVYSLDLPDLSAGTYLLTLVVYDEKTLAAVGLDDGSGVEPVIGHVLVN